MAGTLALSETLCWMPAGWVYDNTLEGIANYIDGELKGRLLASLTEINGGYLDLRSESVDNLGSMKSALQSFIGKIVGSGPSSMHDPTFFDGFVQMLKELDSLLERRLHESVPGATAEMS